MAGAAPVDLDLQRLRHDGVAVQEAFYCDLSEYVYLKAGRGCGKTTVLVFDAVDYAAHYPGSAQLLTEPSWQQVQRVTLPILSDLYGRRRGEGIDWNESPPIDIRVGTSVIHLMGADTVDENRVRGMNLARLLMDEAAQGRQEGLFHLASAGVRDGRYPLQRKFTSTPQGRNWLWRIFTADRHARTAQYVAYSQDAEDAGFVPSGWVEERAREYGGWSNPLARQELLAQELELAGQVFPQFGRGVHVRQAERSGLSALYGGIDFGAVSPTALLVAGLGGGRGQVVREWYRHEATLDHTIRAMADIQAEFGPIQWVADPSGKREMQALSAAGYRVRPARHGNRFELRVQLVGSRLNVGPDKLPGLYIDPLCGNLISELETLQYARHRSVDLGQEELRDKFEPGQPDHAFDALANIVAEWDAVRPPLVRPGGRISVYG